MSEEIYEITTDADGVDCYIKRGELVRCKDCKYYGARQKGKPWNVSRMYCNRSATVAMRPYDYCSKGEREEQEHE